MVFQLGLNKKSLRNMKKKLIQEWGENTAYSAKSHFKSADIKRLWVKSLIYLNLIFAIFSVLDFFNAQIIQVLGVVSLVASVLLLVYETQKENNTISQHMTIGDEYLKIHYDLQKMFYSEKIDDASIDLVSKSLKKMASKNKPAIHQIGKWLAKKGIEEKGEMKTWWK